MSLASEVQLNSQIFLAVSLNEIPRPCSGSLMNIPDPMSQKIRECATLQRDNFVTPPQCKPGERLDWEPSRIRSNQKAKPRENQHDHLSVKGSATSPRRNDDHRARSVDYKHRDLPTGSDGWS